MRKFKPFLFPAGILSLLTLAGCGSNNGTLTLHPTGNYSAASLKGSYVYQIHGTTVSGPYREAGVFTADGAGNITSGSDDFDAGAISPSNPTGTYQVNNDGTGFITLNSTGLGQNNGVSQITLAITLVSSSKVNLIEADAFAEAAGVGELPVVTRLGEQHRDTRDALADGDDEDRDQDAHQADAQPVGRLQRSHCGVHLPVGCWKSRTVRTGPPACSPLSLRVMSQE